MSQARLGKGVSFIWTPDTGSSFASSTGGNEIVDLSGFDRQTETKDATSHQSPTLDKEYIASLTEPGEVSFTLFATGQTLPVQGVAGSLAVTVPYATPKTLTVRGIYVGEKQSYPIDDRMTVELKWKLSGAYSWA